MKQNLKKKAVKIFNFFKKKNLGDMFLYFDNNFNDYYIAVNDKICDTEKYNLVINEYMREFDVSNIHILPKKYLLTVEDLELVDKFINYTQQIESTDYKISQFLEKKTVCVSKYSYKEDLNEDIVISNDYYMAA